MASDRLSNSVLPGMSADQVYATGDQVDAARRLIQQCDDAVTARLVIAFAAVILVLLVGVGVSWALRAGDHPAPTKEG